MALANVARVRPALAVEAIHQAKPVASARPTRPSANNARLRKTMRALSMRPFQASPRLFFVGAIVCVRSRHVPELAEDLQGDVDELGAAHEDELRG